ncbi:hypothetical protein D3C85_1858310 [compost metagenome]
MPLFGIVALGDTAQRHDASQRARNMPLLGIVAQEVAQQLIDAPREGQIDTGQFGGELQIAGGEGGIA